MINIEPLSQKDPRWSSKKLGNGDVSFGMYGCLITCLAMLSRYYGKDTDPGKLNDDLKRVSGFSGAYYVWGSITRLYSDIKKGTYRKTPDPVTDEQFASIDSHLESGHPVMIEVDFYPDTTKPDQHFVLIIGKSRGGYDIADPWTGKVERLSKYGVAKYTIQRYVFYRGPLQSSTPETGGWNLQECETDLANEKKTTTQLSEEIVRLEEEIAGHHEKRKSLEEVLESLNSKLSSKTRELEDLTRRSSETIKSLEKARDAYKTAEENALRDLKTADEKIQSLKRDLNGKNLLNENLLEANGKLAAEISRCEQLRNLRGWSLILLGLKDLLGR
jgi:hypothetical protein